MEDVAKDVAKCIIIDRLTKWYTYTTNYNNNIKLHQESYDRLKNLKETIDSQVQRDKDNLKEPTQLANEWLDKVGELMKEDEKWKQLLDEEKIKGNDQCCFGRFHCNLYWRYEMSKAAEEKAQKIKAIVDEKPDDSRITEPLSISELKTIPSEFLTTLQSRVDLLEKILMKLQDDQVNVVGIFGMGAIGKTTLAKEITNNQEKTKFDKMVMVEISEAPDMERIQNQIAQRLDLDLADVHGVDIKAKKLRHRLTTSGQKILVILDNIWEKLDLAKVGIPQQGEISSEYRCKLMVTSRTKEVCKVMGVKEQDILQVRPLKPPEAKLLFRARVGKVVEKEHEKVENRILNKCQGLPLLIAHLADLLKDQELTVWEHYAAELEKPTSIHGTIRGVNRLTYSILETSYKLLESEEKKRFFLLACLFPLGSSIPVEDMMRYGIGMELFQDVNNLTEAMEQAKTWANELKSSSLLLEDSYYPSDHYVEIHDVVRASMTSSAKEDGHLFMVEAFPRWRNMNTCQKYTAISLMAGTDHSRLHGLMSDKLEILILDRTQPREFDEKFTQYMTNLKVLVLKWMTTCEYRLQNSVKELKSSLRTLHLEYCKLGDIGGIGMLVFLEVLSLRCSTVKELPAEAMRNLCNLRLLDLTGCKIGTKGRIPADVLARLSQLEGLYTRHSTIKWGVHTSIEESNGAEGGSTSTEHAAGDDVDDVEIDSIEYNKYASVDELNKLRYLNDLEMEVELEELPDDGDEFVNNLDQFLVHMISYMDNELLYREHTDWRRVLEVGDLDMRRVMEKKSAKALLMKTEYLLLSHMEGLEHYLVPVQDLDRELPRFEYGVKDLMIYRSSLNVESGINLSAFPNLESLYMKHVNIVRMAVGYQQPKGRGNSSSTSGNDDNWMLMLLPKLQRLNLQALTELEGYVVPIDLLPPNLTSLHVEKCPKLKYIFGEAKSEAYNNNNNKTSLKSLELWGLFQVESMIEVPNSSTSTAASPTSFFNSQSQLTFGALEDVDLRCMDSIVTLWDMMMPYSKEIAVSSYSNLKQLNIETCSKLETICPLSIADALVHLKELIILECEIMREVIRDEDGLLLLESSDGGISNGTQLHPLSLLLFPSLESLTLINCPKMERFISSSSAKQGYNNNNIRRRVIEFPSLHTLEIYGCHEMQSFSAGGPFRAPNLTSFEYDGVQQSMQDVGDDINHFLETRYQQRLRKANEISEVQE